MVRQLSGEDGSQIKPSEWIYLTIKIFMVFVFYNENKYIVILTYGDDIYNYGS